VAKKAANEKKPLIDKGPNPEAPRSKPDTDAPGHASAANPHFPERADAAASAEHTLYLKLDADGNPQWSRMTPRTLETWKKLFEHPSTAAQFSAQALPPEDKSCKPEDAATLLTWLAAGQGFFLARLTGIPRADAMEICALTPEERGSQEPRLARLLNKYGANVLAKYGDEIFFAACFGVGMARRLEGCRERAAQIEAAKQPAPEEKTDADLPAQAGEKRVN
jgi:hypothetical protein